MHIDNPTADTNWRTVLKAQGRTLRWLAERTGKSPRTVYAYASGQITPPADFLASASVVLGVEVTAPR